MNIAYNLTEYIEQYTKTTAVTQTETTITTTPVSDTQPTVSNFVNEGISYTHTHTRLTALCPGLPG